MYLLSIFSISKTVETIEKGLKTTTMFGIRRLHNPMPERV